MKINFSLCSILFILFFASNSKRDLQQNDTNNNQSNQSESENLIVINLPNPKSKLSSDQRNELLVKENKMKKFKMTQSLIISLFELIILNRFIVKPIHKN